MDFVTVYSTNLAVPQRRDAGEARVLAGKKLFYEANCVACHVPKYVTSRNARQAEHRFQLIWPYTDMLVHDMGDDLADGVATAGQRPRMRTPPLGHRPDQDRQSRRDLAARRPCASLLEAVLWHGGAGRRATAWWR